MITHPTAAELVRAVAQWLDSVRSRLDTRDAYLGRVAVNALAVVERELLQRAAAQLELAPRLSTFLNQEGNYETLVGELCARIREGEMSVDTPDLLALLRDDTLARLAVDQPSYRHE